MQWEYLVLDLRSFDSDSLNKLGEDGWELISTIKSESPAEHTKYILIFKRPKE